MAMDAYAESFFANGATLGGIFEMEKVLPKPLEDRLVADWQKKTTGIGNAFNPLFIPPGFKWTQTSSSMADSQNVEHRRFQFEEICRLFGVPTHLVGGQGSTRSTVEQQSLEFVEYCLRPLCTKYETAFTNKCFLGDEKGRFKVEIDMNSLLRADYETRQHGLAIQRQNGVISANEWRKSEGRNPLDPKLVPGADDYLVLSNMGSEGQQQSTAMSKALSDKMNKPAVSAGDKKDAVEEDPANADRAFEPVFTDAVSRLVAREQHYLEEAATKVESRADPKAFYESIQPIDSRKYLGAPIQSYLIATGHKDNSETTMATLDNRYRARFEGRASKFILSDEYSADEATTDTLDLLGKALKGKL
jgi:hypothetical protein